MWVVGTRGKFARNIDIITFVEMVNDEISHTYGYGRTVINVVFYLNTVSQGPCMKQACFVIVAVYQPQL